MASNRLPAPTPSGRYERHKYQRTGPNYEKFGEQPGYFYDSYSDTYHVDPKAREQELQNLGVVDKPPKQPGLAQSLLPIAGVGAALYGGKYLGENIGSIPDKISGLFGGGTVGQSAGTALNTGSNVAGSFGAAAPGAGAAPGAAAGAGAPVGEAATGMFDLGGIGSAGNVLLPAAGAYGAYDVLTGDYGTGRNALEGAASGAAMGSYFGPQGALIGGGIGLGAGLLKGMFDHESTRDLAKKHTSQLLDKSDDPAYQSYVSGMREQYNSAPPDPSKPYHGGQYGSWDEYKKAGLDAADLTGVYGNLNVYGPKWASLTEDQRRAITQKNIDSGIYTSKKGEVEITDSGTAQSNFDSVVNAKPTGMMEPRRSSPRPSQPSRSTQRRK